MTVGQEDDLATVDDQSDMIPSEEVDYSDDDDEPENELAVFFPPEEPAPLIDPEMLREMIVQIVRDELSGDTGERITRSVRKLVRREINQILSARDIT